MCSEEVLMKSPITTKYVVDSFVLVHWEKRRRVWVERGKKDLRNSTMLPNLIHLSKAIAFSMYCQHSPRTGGSFAHKGKLLPIWLSQIIELITKSYRVCGVLEGLNSNRDLPIWWCYLYTLQTRWLYTI